MSSNPCRIFHDWPKWQDNGEGNLRYDGSIVGRFVQQRRYCLRCNKVQLRLRKATFND